MALSNTWGASNRIVEEDLNTVYERETFKKTVGSVTLVYFKYTRERSKRYRYFGLTHEAAVACAEAMNRLYNRVVAVEHLHDPQNESVIWPWFEDGVNNGLTRPTEIVARNDSLYAHLYARKKCGNAVATYSGDDDRWNVNVSVEETLVAHFASTQRTGAHTVWEAFEANPNGKFFEFIGLTYPEAEFYDDAVLGYGSPEA